MKENLINDKDKALLIKTLATINTQAPIEIGLDDLIWGPGKDLRASSTTRWALKEAQLGTVGNQ